jgi:hypothetical protein
VLFGLKLSSPTIVDRLVIEVAFDKLTTRERRVSQFYLRISDHMVAGIFSAAQRTTFTLTGEEPFTELRGESKGIPDEERARRNKITKNRNEVEVEKVIELQPS